MGIVSTASGSEVPGGSGKIEQEQESRPDEKSVQEKGPAHCQTLWILIFTGHPRDLQSTRVTELYIVFDDDERKNINIQLQGQYPSYRVEQIWNQSPPRARPNFFQRLAVSSLSSDSDLDMRLRDGILRTPVNNNESDWGCQSWVGDVVTQLQGENLILDEEGDHALNSMVNYISQAPWR
ncbi:hypothetical protein F4778DRAFT_782329 [Xylariomycetidae sp. FL2044]|nr:hypothetical protein F4778DRAFT_782329 [Xylariomycetidae sp. FL2044]